MLLTDFQIIADRLAFPCTYDELLEQMDRHCIRQTVIDEVAERFREEYEGTTDPIYLDDFKEVEEYPDDEVFNQDD